MPESTALRPPSRFSLPRPLAERLNGLRRDLRALTGGFWGERLPVTQARDGSGWARRRVQTVGELARRSLVVIRVDQLTPTAVRIRLADPSGAPVLFHPGQFLTLCITLDGVEHRRAYSLCSDPTRPQEVAIGVKRAGQVSAFLIDQLAPEARLDVLGPSGSYGLVLDPQAQRHVMLVAGGSGITPQLALAQGILRAEPGSRVGLLYANRSADEVMFAAEVADLQREFPDRFALRLVLEDASPDFGGGLGRLDPEGAAREVAALQADEAEWFVCGPAPMMEAVCGVLADRGVQRVHVERFTPAPRSQGASTTPQALLVRLGGTRIATEVAPGATLLEAGLAARAAMPYSCALGGCGACRVKRISGEVVMDEPNCLTARERAEGYLLACVSRPVGPVEIEVPR